MSKRIVIIGGGDAGTYTLEAITKRGSDIAVTLLKKDKHGSVSICGMPFALQGIYPVRDIELQGPEFFIDNGIDYRIETEVTTINLEDGNVVIQTGEELKYDYLVIATGSRPFIPQVPGVEREGVYTVKDMEDGKKIEVAMHDPGVKNAVVIGAGTVALQVAVAFSKNNIKTTVTKPRPMILRSMLDPDIASSIQKRLEEMEIRFTLGKETVAIKGDGHVKSVLIGDAEIPADIVVTCTGMRPNIDLAKEAGIEIGETGGIATDPFLHVKTERGYINNVYATGDCVEVIDAITHRPRLSMLASTCVTQARVIADNIFGENSSFDPVLSPTVANIAGLQVGSVGITSATAKRYGIKVISGKKEKPTKPRYYPGRKSMVMKLLFDAYIGRLIGAQIVSEDPVADRIDELSIAIRCGMTAKELRMMEKSFDPSVALHRDVMADAAEDALMDEGNEKNA